LERIIDNAGIADEKLIKDINSAVDKFNVRFPQVGMYFCSVELDDSSVSQRPYNQILDLARWLSLTEKEATQIELCRLFQENQIDVFPVTRATQPPQGAQTYARKLGETWSKAPVWCVVFHVPGDPIGFHVEAGGVEINREKVDRAVEEACKRARRESTEKDRVMAAWKECSEGLRFVHASGELHNERVVEVKKQMRTGMVEDKKRNEIILVVAAVALLLFLLISCGLIRMLRKRKYTFEFPETTWQTRFQAPHIGGGCIVVNYRSKRLK
jgi:hypothetical protein